MPRKLSEIKEFVSKKSLEKIDQNPAYNSVMGNVKKLHDALEGANDFASTELRDRLGAILDAHAGKVDEKTGNSHIEFLHSALELYYMTKTDPNVTERIPDENKRQEMKNLIEYVAGGLKLSDNLKYKSKITVSEDQQINLNHMENVGRSEVAIEKAEAEAQARRDAVKGKSGLNLLDEHKAKVNALPKSFRGEDAAGKEAQARKQLKDICIDIMATRRAINAKRNDKSGLAKSVIDADYMHSVKQDLAQNKVIDKFLNNMSYSDLRKLAAEGHGGAMEEKFAEHLKTNAKEIPADAPQHYMPTAKERIEALQKKMDNQSFKNTTTPGDQRELYIELMATRAAVGSKRGVKSSLNPKVDAAALERERQILRQEPMRTALARVTQMGDKQKKACDAALSGHGGALDDLVRTELRRMAVEKESGYKMQQVDMRYAPTYDQRRQDLKALTESGQAPLKAQLRAALELGVLETVQGEHQGDAKITTVDTINRQTDDKMKIYSQVMDSKAMRAFINNAREHGTQTAVSKFEIENAGQIKAVSVMNEIDEKLAANPSKEELQELAARKMVLLEEKVAFQMNKRTEELRKEGGALINDDALIPGDDISADEKFLNKISEAELSKKAAKLMKSGTFAEMCEKLGPDKLLKQAQGSGTELMNSYGKVLDGTLKAGPAAEQGKNVVQNNMAKEKPAGGMQIGGQ